MKTYHMIDKKDRHGDGSFRAELKHYTFDELKNYFKPDINNLSDREDEDELNSYKEECRRWEAIQSLYDLECYLQWSYGYGEEVPYEFEEDEIEDEAARQRANDFFATAHPDDIDYV